MKRRTLLLLASLLAAGITPLGVHAAWPDKVIRIVVPFPPSGSDDVLARLVGAKLASCSGRQW